MPQYETIIGLEIHAQLVSESKLFCGCSTRFGEPPNTQTCPVCLGLPGVLPVLNKRAVEMAIKTALALHCQIASSCRFARKNYFYPDLPKGYQISQYELPLAGHGFLDIEVDGGTKRIGITRVHMEEDAGKNIHEGIGEGSGVDFNRSGVPLLEIVSEPDLRSPEEAVAYVKKLKEILVYLGVSDGNMEKGNLRCDANVSLRPVGQKGLGIKTEVKNMNSFRFIQRALEYEVQRQEKALREGRRIAQETRLFDPESGKTALMRSKEEAHDYRYFPDPDLVPLNPPPGWIDEIQKTLPELPDAKRERFIREHGLPPYDAMVLTASRALADYFERSIRLYPKPKTVSNWIMVELLAVLRSQGKEVEESPVSPEQLASLLLLVEKGTLSGPSAKTVFEEMCRTGKDPETIVREKGLIQVTDESEIEALVEEVLKNNPREVEFYKGGKERLFPFFVGQVIKASKGRANPAKVNEILKKRLGALKIV